MFKAQTLPCPVISVGNIAVGGTGKTPAVIAIAGHLQKAGLRVAILLRGYKREARAGITVVSDGRQVYASAKESGDEAYMMAHCLSGVPIIVGRERYLAGQIALERFNVDVLLLDDGFQHRQLRRDVDILTVPVTHPFGDPPRLLPAGTLREPPAALRRADIILLTHADAPESTVCAKAAVKRFAPEALVLESVSPAEARLSAHPWGQRRTSGYRAAQRQTASCGLWHWESRRFCGDPHAVFSSER